MLYYSRRISVAVAYKYYYSTTLVWGYEAGGRFAVSSSSSTLGTYEGGQHHHVATQQQQEQQQRQLRTVYGKEKLFQYIVKFLVPVETCQQVPKSIFKRLSTHSNCSICYNHYPLIHSVLMVSIAFCLQYPFKILSNHKWFLQVDYLLPLFPCQPTVQRRVVALVSSYSLAVATIASWAMRPQPPPSSCGCEQRP